MIDSATGPQPIEPGTALNKLPYNQDAFFKELGLVQDVIKRMAANSFDVKKWALGSITFTLAFAFGKDGHLPSGFVCFLLEAVLAMFWYLDGFFLQQEQFYRRLYTWLIENRPQGDASHLMALNPQARFSKEKMGDKGVPWVLEQMFSKTLFPFYGVPMLAVAIFSLYIAALHFGMFN